MSSRVLVIGASGFVGTRLAKQLVGDGIVVRALSRSGAPVEVLEVVTGDATTVEAVAKALPGCDSVCLCVPWQQEPAVARAVVEASARLGLRPHVFFVSGITVVPANAGNAMVDAKLSAEQTLITSGLDCTLLKPSWFMDALSLFVRDGRATLFGKQQVPFKLVALDDFVKGVSALVRAPGQGVQTVVFEGAEAMTLEEALKRYCQVAHPTLKPSTLPTWVGRVLAFFARNESLSEFVGMMTFFSKVSVMASGTELAPTSFEQWLRGVEADQRLTSSART